MIAYPWLELFRCMKASKFDTIRSASRREPGDRSVSGLVRRVMGRAESFLLISGFIRIALQRNRFNQFSITMFQHRPTRPTGGKIPLRTTKS